MPGWNIADVFEVVAAAVPGSPARIQGDRVLSWRELDTRAGQVAAYLAARGLGRQVIQAAVTLSYETLRPRRSRVPVPWTS